VALIPQTSGTAPSDDGGRPSPEEIEKKLDYLYGRAGSPTVRQAAQEKEARQRGRVAALLDDVARRTDVLSKARQKLGSFTAAPYRTGDTASETAALLFAETPQGYFDPAQVMSRLNARHKGQAGSRAAQPAAPPRPREAPRTPEPPAEPQYDIAAAKAAMQKKLAHARVLLSAPTTREAAPEPPTPSSGPTPFRSAPPSDPTPFGPTPFRSAPPGPAPSGPLPSDPAPSGPAPFASAPPGPALSGPAPSGPTSDSAYATKAEKALAFARAQIGKPCVWGATGPGSYDCSGLTQAAWKAAGVTLPRTTHDQAHAGTAVPLAEARPGDLVFLSSPSDDTDHVGVYAGDGVMVHAPRSGACVREESIHHGGESSVRRVVRPA
jgi:cell wall-associated NlpC family hydrolase